MKTVGVLKLVDQDVFIAAPDRKTNVLVIADQGAYVQKKVIKVEHGRVALAPLVTFQQQIQG